MRPLILWHILGSYFLLIWGWGWSKLFSTWYEKCNKTSQRILSALRQSTNSSVALSQNMFTHDFKDRLKALFTRICRHRHQNIDLHRVRGGEGFFNILNDKRLHLQLARCKKCVFTHLEDQGRLDRATERCRSLVGFVPKRDPPYP